MMIFDKTRLARKKKEDDGDRDAGPTTTEVTRRPRIRRMVMMLYFSRRLNDGVCA